MHPGVLGFNTPTLVTAFAAVSVCEAIEAVAGGRPQIKWVNDIFMGGKKVCGILAEAVDVNSINDISQVSDSNIHTNNSNAADSAIGAGVAGPGRMPAVVGIGVNVTMPPGGYPVGIKNIAGAVFTNESFANDAFVCDTPAGGMITDNMLASDMLAFNAPACGAPPGARARLAAEIINRMAVSALGEEYVLQEYRRRMPMLGKKITVTGVHGSFEATAESIDSAGRLIVKNDEGVLISLSSGDISIKYNQNHYYC